MAETTANEEYSGILRISAFLTSNGQPAEGVRITVADTDGTVIAEGLTDREGIVRPITLEAPSAVMSLTPPSMTEGSPESESELPENGTEAELQLPYGIYQLTAISPRGQTVTINDLQIYAGVTSLQSIIFPGQDNSVTVLSPVIMGGFPEKIPESDTKRLPSAEGTVVLPRPVVPGLIVVHDGVPSDKSAPDYTVSFKDYIKNVASSEIYATWPREALKANILAICSFTMNRVYTEWYRGKGYSFTITNSTAFDQAFVYGRNIFASISDVVDEIFNLYITREGLLQPLLTQYCDGVRVRRSGWLSQWGSKELADEGYSALQILRYYYGRNIILREAEKVEGIPQSFPGFLQQGSRGEGVRTLQRQLNVISKNFPLIPKLSVDGIYGPKTALSVRTFQQIFNLPVTGTVGFSTWYSISDIYVAVSKLAELV